MDALEGNLRLFAKLPVHEAYILLQVGQEREQNASLLRRFTLSSSHVKLGLIATFG